MVSLPGKLDQDKTQLVSVKYYTVLFYLYLHIFVGRISNAGETVYTKSEWRTTVVDGKPVTRWTNVTTVKDASGKIIKTYYSTDDHEGDQVASSSNVDSFGQNIGKVPQYDVFVKCSHPNDAYFRRLYPAAQTKNHLQLFRRRIFQGRRKFQDRRKSFGIW